MADLDREKIQVIFRLQTEEYALPIAAVSEILRVQKLTRMPRAPHFVLGVMNLRGRVFPVIDLKKRLGLPQSEADARTRIMVVEFGGDRLGLVVDEVREVFRGEDSHFGQAPELTRSVTSDYLQGVLSRGERIILQLDMNRLFVTEEAAAARGAA